MQESAQLDSKAGSDTDRNIHQGGIGEEQRRNSAPEMEDWQRPDKGEGNTPAIPVPKVVQRLTHSAIPSQPLIVEPNPTQGAHPSRLHCLCLPTVFSACLAENPKP